MASSLPRNDVRSLPAEDAWLVDTSHKYPLLYYALVRVLRHDPETQERQLHAGRRVFWPNLQFSMVEGVNVQRHSFSIAPNPPQVTTVLRFLKVRISLYYLRQSISGHFT